MTSWDWSFGLTGALKTFPGGGGVVGWGGGGWGKAGNKAKAQLQLGLGLAELGNDREFLSVNALLMNFKKGNPGNQ